MKLVRFGNPGQEKPGVIDTQGHVRDLSAFAPDITGEVLNTMYLAKLSQVDSDMLPLVPTGARLGPCVGGIGKVICVGLNYSDHATEANLPLPKEPILFLKAPSAVIGPYDVVQIPRGAKKVD